MKFQSEKQYMKMNLLRIAKHHKRTCPGENCDVSLFALGITGRRAGLKFTKKEEMTFI